MNTESERPARRRSRYLKECRRDAAALVIEQHRTIVDVARELGAVEQTLGNWVRQERIDRGEREDFSSAERAEIVQLRRERHLLKKSNGLLGEGVRPVTRYRWISARKAQGHGV
jgi:transposase-like protein